MAVNTLSRKNAGTRRALVVCPALMSEMRLAGCESIREADDAYSTCATCVEHVGMEPDGYDECVPLEKQSCCRVCDKKLYKVRMGAMVPPAGRICTQCRKAEMKERGAAARKPRPKSRIPKPNAERFCAGCGKELRPMCDNDSVPMRGRMCRPCWAEANRKRGTPADRGGPEAEARVSAYFQEEANA